MMQTYQHWRLETDSDQILWVYFDKKNTSVNVISYEVMMEFASIVDMLAQDTTHKGAIIASAKKNGFIAGADITQFTNFKDIEESTKALVDGQSVFNDSNLLKTLWPSTNGLVG